MQTVADYARYLRRLRDAMGPHIQVLLKAGLSVVLDFPANTPAIGNGCADCSKSRAPPIACISST